MKEKPEPEYPKTKERKKRKECERDELKTEKKKQLFPARIAGSRETRRHERETVILIQFFGVQ